MDQDHDRWWEKEGDDLGSAVWELGTSLQKDQEDLESNARHFLELYDGRTDVSIRSGSGRTVCGDYDTEDLDFNVSRAACDTVHAEIAGRQKPVAKFQTSDADWETKRRAKKMEKFCRGVLHQRQGPFLNAWELMEAAFRDSCVWGMGAVKVFPKDGVIKMERHYQHELFVDPDDSKYGQPSSLFHVYFMEKDLALKCFVEDADLSDKEAREIGYAIEASEAELEGDERRYERVHKRVKIVESWRLPVGNNHGKHVFTLNNKLLHEEDWKRQEFPFVFMRWDADLVGWRAKGLVEQGAPIHHEVTFNARKMQERFKICGSNRTFFEEGSVDESHLESNEAEVFIPVRKGFQMPQMTTAKPIAEAEMQYLQYCYDKYYEITGISQMRAQARKEPGVTAGVAIRTLNDMQTARFALKAKGYENAYVQLANQIIYCAREMAESGSEVSVRYDEEIKWKEVSLPEDTFEISIAPTSSLPNDPAGRMQMTQELYSAGIIQVETFKQLLGWPDLEKEMNFQTAQVRYIEKVVDRMLDKGEQEEPDPHLIDKQGALLQVAQAYLDALYDDAPSESLSLLSNYIQELDHMIAEGQKAAAMSQAMLQQEVAEVVSPGGGVVPPQADRPPVVEEVPNGNAA